MCYNISWNGARLVFTFDKAVLKMKILDRINRFYSRYLFAIIPIITLVLAAVEVIYEIRYGDMMHIAANITMGFISLSFCGFYLMSGKQRASYCLIELYLFVYTAFLALDNHLHFGAAAWIIFLPCAVSCVPLIILLNKKGK